MKVIKKGREQKGWSTEATCTGAGNGGGGCKAELLVEQEDIKVKYMGDDCVGKRQDYFRCCECGVRTELKGVPPHVGIGK